MKFTRLLLLCLEDVVGQELNPNENEGIFKRSEIWKKNGDYFEIIWMFYEDMAGVMDTTVSVSAGGRME